MTAERFFNILGSIVVLGTVTVVLTSPRTASVIKASADFFTGSISAAMGN